MVWKVLEMDDRSQQRHQRYSCSVVCTIVTWACLSDFGGAIVHIQSNFFGVDARHTAVDYCYHASIRQDYRRTYYDYKMYNEVTMCATLCGNARLSSILHTRRVVDTGKNTSSPFSPLSLALSLSYSLTAMKHHAAGCVKDDASIALLWSAGVVFGVGCM